MDNESSVVVKDEEVSEIIRAIQNADNSGVPIRTDGPKTALGLYRHRGERRRNIHNNMMENTSHYNIFLSKKERANRPSLHM
jgi:hypothetical protein